VETEFDTFDLLFVNAGFRTETVSFRNYQSADRLVFQLNVKAQPQA
jgi:hypothetical protein